ncbi:MAG TPA: trp operon repressor [Chlamydiales bacterium]|nr:trp operon repressor [Chlamydiales bacterium]
MRSKPAEEGWRKFLKLSSKVKTPEMAELLFNLLLTLEEKEMLGQRIMIIKALMEEKMTQREIAEKYGVSISQITRGSNALKIIDEETGKFLQANIK